jgi:hypothetical protein
MFNAYRWRRVGVEADRNHYDIRECPDRYDPGERVYATEEVLTARSLSCKHVVTHHHKTLRHEE